MPADIIALLKADTGDFTARMAEAKGQVADLSKSGSSNMSKLQTVGKAAFLGLGVAAVGVVAASAKLGMSFQQTEAQIAASGATSMKVADGIGKAFLGTAGTTTFSAQQIGTAFAAVAGQVKTLNGGVLNAKAAMDVMKPAMDLAEASGTALSNATADVTKTLQQFGLGISSSPLVANVLYNAARQTGTSVDSLAGQLQKAASRMGAAAPPVNQLGGLLVDLTKHGETGRAAMSALGTAFNGIIAPTTAATAAQKYLGVSFTTAKGQLLPLGQVIGELQPKLAGMGNAQAAAALKALGFGSASDKLLGVIRAGPAAFAAATAAVSKHNSVADAAKQKEQTLQGQFETVKSAVQDYATKLGVALLPMIEAVAKATEKIVQWFTKHKAAAIALAVVVGGLLVGAMAAAAVAFIAANAAALGIGLAIAALAAGAIYLATHWKQTWDTVKRVFDDALKFLRGGFGTLAILILTGPMAPMIELALHWQQIWNAIKGVVKPALDIIVAELKFAWDVVSDITKAAWDVISDVVKVAWHVISDVVKVGIDVIVGIFKVIGDLLTGNWKGAWNAIKDTATQVWNAIKDLAESVWNGIVDIFKTVVGTVVSLIETWVGTVKTILETAWNAVRGTVTTVWGDIVSFFTGVPGKLIGALKSLGGKLLSWIEDAFKTMKSWIESAWNKEVAFWTTLPAKLITAVRDLGSRLLSWIETAWSTFKAWIETAWNNEVAFWSAIPAKVIAAVEGLLGMLLNFGKSMMSGLANGIYAGWQDIGRWFSDLGSVVGRLFSGAVNWLEGAGEAILRGLWNGMKKIWDDVTGWLGGLAGDIAKLKGPESYDATILVENGKAIMKGLHDGMQQGFAGQVTPFLAGVAKQISSTNFGTLTAGFNAGVAPMAGYGSGTAVGAGSSVPVTVQTTLQVDGVAFAKAIQPGMAVFQRQTTAPIAGAVR